MLGKKNQTKKAFIFLFKELRVFLLSVHTCTHPVRVCLPPEKCCDCRTQRTNRRKSALTKKILLCFQLKVMSSRGERAFFRRTASQGNLCTAVVSRLTPCSSLGATPHAQPWLGGRLRGDLISTSRSRKSEVLNGFLI